MTPETCWQDARVTQIIERTPRIKSFVLALTRPFVHRGGQHVDLRLTAADGYKALRSYSIASAPAAGTEIELAIERLDDGEVSEFFHDVVRVDDIIELRGPLGGHFVWSPADTGPLLLAGGGSGLVPLMAILRHRKNAALYAPSERSDPSEPSTPSTHVSHVAHVSRVSRVSHGTSMAAALLVSARSWDDVLYRDELLAMEDANLRIILTLTREQPRRPGDYGRRVDAAMLAEVIGGFAAPVERALICGSNAFVNAVADGAVAAGIASSRIKTERYGG